MSNVRNIIDSNEKIPINVNFSEDIKDKIKEYSISDLSRELGGVLLGYVESDSQDNYNVNVTDYLIAKHTDAKLSSVTFTAETWADINKEKDKKDPELKIVGWFHTHPGFGIFLSNWDIFIQENFFNIPWQIAYVVDPCHKTDGLFIWKENEILKLYENSFENIKIDKNTDNNEKIVDNPNKEKKLFNISCLSKFNKSNKIFKINNIILIILIIIVLILIIYIIYKYFISYNFKNIFSTLKNYFHPKL